MLKLVLLRHGESLWNLENRFTGWTDVDLSEKGKGEAKHAGELLNANGFTFDSAWTSVLKRAVRTLWITLDTMDRMWVPVHNSWRLNERHYGELQGLNKADTAARYGAGQVQLWRRSYDVKPPLLRADDARNPVNSQCYQGVPGGDLPLGESLKDTIDRVMPLWKDCIAPRVLHGERTIIVAHGNTLRGLIKQLDGISNEEIVKLEIPTGVPLVYELDYALKPIKNYYLK